MWRGDGNRRPREQELGHRGVPVTSALVRLAGVTMDCRGRSGGSTAPWGVMGDGSGFEGPDGKECITKY